MDNEKDRPFPRNIRTTVKPRATYAAANVLLLLLTVLSTGCSTRKNTAGTRFYHAMTTRYNVYHNGQEAYRAGLEEQRKGNHDNYMELLPLYPEGNKETTALGGSQFDRAIEKAQKAIRRHSIKRKPRRTPGKAYTSQYRQWLQRKEFNPFLHRAWMLLGKAQYQKGDYEDAAGTFAYIARLYDGQPDIVSEALIRLSRCYAALGWQYDAEDALKRIPADSLSRQLTTEYASSAGATMLTGKRYREAIPYIERTARDERDKHLKARHYYLLGQLYQQTEQPGADVAAYEGRGQGRDQQRRQPFHGQAAAARMAAPVGRGAQAADVPVQKNVGHGRIGRQYQPLHRDAGQGGRLLPQQGRQMVTYQPGEPGPAFGRTGHGQTGHDVRACSGLRVEVVPFGHHGHRQGRTAEQGKIIRGRFFPDIGDGDQAPVQRCGAQIHGQGQMLLFRERGRGRGHDRHFFRCGHIEMQLRAHGVSYLTTAGQTPARGHGLLAEQARLFRLRRQARRK